MAKSLKVPVGVNSSGGAALTEKSPELRQIIRLAISEGGDDNAFQKLGLPEDMIFSLSDEAFKQFVFQAIQSRISRFISTGRMKLSGDGIVINEEPGIAGSFIVVIHFIDLEFANEDEITIPLSNLVALRGT